MSDSCAWRETQNDIRKSASRLQTDTSFGFRILILTVGLVRGLGFVERTKLFPKKTRRLGERLPDLQRECSVLQGSKRRRSIKLRALLMPLDSSGDLLREHPRVFQKEAAASTLFLRNTRLDLAGVLRQPMR